MEEIAKGDITIDPFNRDQVGPGSIDLRLGVNFRIFKPQARVFSVTNMPDFKQLTEAVTIKEGENLVIKPHQTVLGVTEERVSLAPRLCGWLEGRSRFSRIGIAVHITAGFIQPGIDNHQVLEITNLSPTKMALYPGTKICQLIIERCEGEARYLGKFKDQVKP